jgi:hypothetical protein
MSDDCQLPNFSIRASDIKFRTLMTEATGRSKSRYSFYQTTRRHRPEDSDARHTTPLPPHTHPRTRTRALHSFEVQDIQ